MTWFSKPSLPALLNDARATLDQIFGEGAYRIESDGPEQVSVRSRCLRLELAHDRRDGSIGSELTVTGPWGEETSDPEGWAQFLGEEMPPFPRNGSGHATQSIEEQVRAELKKVARLSDILFSDPQKTRDAVHFVRGYGKAYNDWASGAWDPD
ncbi:MAG TPA: hypothetical protein VF582_05495 [Allosphingosinicella sp.]|jgi:hypothetical protein